MAQYPDLATLRSALTSDDSERRAEAYGVVYEQTDFSPQDVLQDDDLEGPLQESGVVEAPDDRPDTVDQRERMIALLEQIADNTGGN